MTFHLSECIFHELRIILGNAHITLFSSYFGKKLYLDEHYYVQNDDDVAN